MLGPRHHVRLLRYTLLPVLLLTAASLVLAAPLQDRLPAATQTLPEPRPKLSLSAKEAQPAVVAPGDVVSYTIAVRNTGAAAAPDTQLWDSFPANTTYNGDATASTGTILAGTTGLTWTGEVAFDSSAIISFSVSVATGYTGRITNIAVITQPDILAPVTVTAACTATDTPILWIDKEGTPILPGAGKPLTYTLWVGNVGQPAENLPVTVTDQVPADTSLLAVGSGAITDTAGHITWTRPISLALGERTPFTFSVQVDDGVPSGTVLLNAGYAVTTALPGVGAVGEPYTLTVVTPILLLVKQIDPDPPGSNRSMVYTLTLFNYGSLATDLVVTDTVPANVTYLAGGTYFSSTGTISWTRPSLASSEKATFTYTAFVGNLPGGTLIINDHYGARCAEGIVVAGRPLTSTVQGPIFDESFKSVDPIAKKPGGGPGEVLTYTIGIRNTGAGNAFDALVTDYLYNLGSIDAVIIDPPTGTYTITGCPPQCDLFAWTGNVPHDSQITITIHASSSFAGRTIVTNTAVISDDLTLPVSATTRLLITFDAKLNVYKDAPAVIGPNETMTYTLWVINSAFATSPTVWLTDVLPLEVSYIASSGDGAYISATRMVSWTLPAIATGGDLSRTVTVQVGDYPSGTLIIDEDFAAGCGNCIYTDAVYLPVTTTVQVRGLGDSYKVVSPAVAYPGPAVVLTYTVYVVNSSGFQLDGVHMTDYLPWVMSTYNRDAIASAGSLISDIVHLEWSGDMAPFQTTAVTMSVTVDPWYKGAVTNTAVITHPSLAAPVTVTAVAYVTDEPVLHLSKVDRPDPVGLNQELQYTLYLRNLGQLAKGIVLSDTIPLNTVYVPGSATRGGTLLGDTIRWEWPELAAGAVEPFAFRVVVEHGPTIVNESYLSTCAEGIWAYGDPVETDVVGTMIYLPLIFKTAP